MEDGLRLLRAREARCEAFRLSQQGEVDPVEWCRAAALLRHLRAWSPAVSAFMPIAALCTCPATTAVVVHLCVQWGGCELQLVDGKLRKELCRQAGCSRSEFIAAYDTIMPKLDGGDVRAWGPSSFEYVYEQRSQLTRHALVLAVRACLIRSKRRTSSPASEVAASVLADSSAAGYAGSLVTRLLQKTGECAEERHSRVRPVPDDQVERVVRMKCDDVAEQ